MPILEELNPKIVEELTSQVRFASLATISDDGPVIRSIGSWAIRGTALYFSTSGSSAKVSQLAKDARVSVQLLAEGQELTTLRNFVLNGAAKLLEGNARDVAIEAIGARNARFRERAAKGQLAESAIYAVKAKQVKVLDFSKGIGGAALSVFEESQAAQ
jgi:pyridoxamine 5'-phosphate oxidase